MEITNTFKCHELSADKIRYETCLIRQQAMMMPNSKSKHPKYPVCYYCEKGKEIKAKFPDWKYAKNNKHKKPDRMYLRKKSGSKETCLNAIDLKPETKGAEMIPKRPIGLRNQEYNAEKHSSAPKIKPFNAKLFVKAQGQYIKSLIKQKKTVEAKERIDMVINELSARGLNYREFEDGA